VAREHRPGVPAAPGAQAVVLTLHSDRAFWRAVLLWLLTREQPGLPEASPEGMVHFRVREASAQRGPRAIINGNDAWVQR
jgi:hypothetical protein